MIGVWAIGQVAPLVFLLIAGDYAAIGAGVVVAIMIGIGVVRWLRFSWRLEPQALVIEEGLLSRRRRVIPFERVQSVDLVRGLRHRLFGVAELRVEVVGGTGTEGRLEALDPATATRLRAALLRARAEGGGAALFTDLTPAAAAAAREQGEQLVRLSPGRLVVAGLTGSRVGVAAALIGGAQELLGERVTEVFRLPEVLGTTRLVALVAVVVVLAFALSVAATAFAYWDFTLVRDGDELRVRRGLLEQRLETIPLRRLQAVRVEENLLRRPFRLAAVKVDIAGRAGSEEGQQAGTVLPLGSREQAHALAATLLAAAGVTASPPRELAGMPSRALRRRVVRGLVWAAVLAGVVYGGVRVAGMLWERVGQGVPTGEGGLAAAVFVLMGVVLVALGVAGYRALGWAVGGDVVVARAGALVRRTAYVPRRRLQGLALAASPFQRLARLATLELQIARSPGVWGGPQLIDLDRADGEALLFRLAAELVGGRRG